MHLIRKRAGEVATAALMATPLLLAVTALPAGAKPAPCPGGRYVLSSAPRSNGGPALASGTITLDGSTVSLSAGCSGAVRMRHAKGGTRLRATLASCASIRGKVRLKGGIDGTCRRMWGSIATRKGRSRFEAELSLCGNGVIDDGEECDDSACADGAGCNACRCDRDGIPGPGCTPGIDPGCASGGVGSTTTTTTLVDGGTSTTSTTLAGASTSTTTTILSSTTTTTAPRDPFKCYKVREGGARFQPGPLNLVDQFGAASNVVNAARRLCNPVDEDGEGVSDPTAHLMCYDLDEEAGFVRREVVTRNRFGDQTLTIVRPDSLCVPAEKDGVQSVPNLNRFKCYRVVQEPHARFIPRIVTLADQFETRSTTVEKPHLFCNPVDANGQGIDDPENHLTCYRIPAPLDFVPRDVSVEDEFTVQQVRAFRGTCRKVALLCEPSLKDPGAGTTTTTFPPGTSSSTTSTSSTSTITSPPPSTTSSSIGGSTTTSSTSTTSSAPAGTSSSTTTTPSTTITTTSLASTTTAPTPSTTTTSTSSTTSTTAPSGIQCSATGLDVTVGLDYSLQIVGGVSAILLKTSYAPPLAIPGTGTESNVRMRVTNLAGAGSSLSVSDRDTNTDGVDDLFQVTARKTQGSLEPAPVFRVRFDCPIGTNVSPSSFPCTHEQATDLSGLPLAPQLANLISCVVTLTAP